MTDETKYMPGPFTVTQPEVWPFDIEVIGPDGNLAWSERRYAHVSRQNSVDECMRAVGFPYDERPEIESRLKRQLADVTLRAAAPELLEALMAVEMARHTDAKEDWLKATVLTEAAIVKATVRSE